MTWKCQLIITIITLVEQHVMVAIHVCKIYPVVTITNSLHSNFSIHPSNLDLNISFSRRYNSRYSYSTDHYQKQSQNRPANKMNKRGNSATTDHSQTKSTINAGPANLSDNEQKEGEEWETASESSANMRNNHHENDQPIATEIKPINRDRTPPKKSFASQR